MTFNLRLFSSLISIIIIAFLSLSTYAQEFKKEKYKFYNSDNLLSLSEIGGFNAPQFMEIDVNNDGIDDMVIFDRDVEFLRVLINKGLEGEVSYVPAPEYESDFPNAVNFMRSIDFNKDGAPDLFVGNFSFGIPGIFVYRGYYENDVLKFRQMLFPDFSDDLLRFKSQSGIVTQINTTTIDLPSFVDIDSDGDIDMLNFVLGGGTMSYFENKAMDLGLGIDTFSFVISENCWGGFYESDFSEEIKLANQAGDCASFLKETQLRHSGSTITGFDADRDGDIDLLIGDLTSERIVYLENGGSSTEAFMTSQDAHFPSYDESVDMNLFLATFLIDVDNDGRKDLLVSPNSFNGARNTDNILYYKNIGNDGVFLFEKQSRNLFENSYLDLSATSVPAIVDVNGDGLLDLIVGTYGQVVENNRFPSLVYYENRGSLEEPEFHLMDDDWLEIGKFLPDAYAFAPSFGDLDGDGYIDMIIGDNSGEIHYFKNDQSSNEGLSFISPEINFAQIDQSNYAVPQIIDMNGDGLGDLLIGEQNGNAIDGLLCGSINQYINIGTIGSPQFNFKAEEDPNSPCWGNISTRDNSNIKFHSSPHLIMIEDDWHAIAGGVSGRISSYRNINPMSKDEFELDEFRFGNIYPGMWSHPRLANLDSDDYLELIVGHKGGGIQIYETNWTIKGTVPVKPVLSQYLKIYPNPTEEYFYIESDHEIDFVEIYNSHGVKLHSYDAVGKFKQFSELNNGIYFVIIKTKISDETFSRKIVVMP